MIFPSPSSHQKTFIALLLCILVLGLFFAPSTTRAGWWDDFVDWVGDTVSDVFNGVVGVLENAACWVDDTWLGDENCEGALPPPSTGSTALPLNSGASSNSTNTNNATGQTGSCSVGTKLCGTNSCIPSDASCCANIGVTNQYCVAGYYCSGNSSGGASCTSNSSGTAQCSSLQGTKCVSPANSCNQTNSSDYQCDGSCTVYTPPDSGCATPDITLTVPSFTAYGKECAITSKVKNASSCSINGTNVVVPDGTFFTPPLTKTTDFTLVCKNGSVVSAQKTVTCRLTPSFQEI